MPLRHWSCFVGLKESIMKNSNWISFGLSLSLSVCAASPFLAAKAFADDANLMSGPVIEVGVGNDSRSGTISKGGSGIQGQAIFRSGVAEGSLGIGGSTANSGGANHEHLNLTVPWSKDGIMGKSGLYVVSETNMTSTPFRSTITPLSIGVGGLTSDRSTRVIATVSPWNSEQLAPDAYLLGKTTSQSAHLNLEHNFGNVIVLSGDVLAGTFSKMHSRVQTSADAGTTTGSQPLTEYFPGFEQVG